MNETRRRWGRAVIFFGVAYALVGILFALPSSHVRAWRWAAWAVSAVAFGAHIGYERFRLAHSSRTSALHAALAAALGALGLAVGANVHALSAGTNVQHRQLLLLALVAWPLVTGVPAFLVALAVSVVLGLGRQADGRNHD